MINKELKQSQIIKLLSLGIFIFSIIGQILSLDKFASIPYCVMGCILSFIIVIKSNKIQLFSPIYHVFSSIFFTFIFSGLYYFIFSTDIMNRPIINDQNSIFEINTIYILFFLSIILPISIYLFSKKYYLRTTLFSGKFPLYNLNSKLLIMNLLFVLWIVIALIYSGMNLFMAIKNPLAFRYAISNGSISILNIFFLFCIPIIYTIYLKEIFTHGHYIKYYNKLIFWAIVIIWSIICGSRFFLIFIIMFLFMVFYTFYNKIRLQHIIWAILGILFALTFSSILLLYRMLGANSTNFNFQTIQAQVEDINIFEDFAERNDSFANSIQFFRWIEHNNGTILFYTNFQYKKEILNHLTKYLPKNIRNLFKNDNFDLFTLQITKKLAPRAAETNTTFAYGGISNIYWNFGIFGLIVFGLLFGCLTVIFEMLFNSYKYKDLFQICYFMIFKFLTNFFAVGLINCPLTMELLYTLPLLFILILFFTSKKSFTIRI